ncbi:MAG: type II secretion system protein [Candidatus Gracilibacteria bacterium]|jgi:prepilin-type N-terminal cleavage/methylation domain-containing protein
MNMPKVYKKNGFTLIEILIVLFIIGLLSMLAIGGYNEYRRLALLNYSAEQVVAQIVELKDQVIHGINTADSGGKCAGVFFDDNGGDVYRFTTPYDFRKRWEGSDVDGIWIEGECNIKQSSDIDKLPFELDQNVELKANLNEKIVFMFLPPEGIPQAKRLKDGLDFGADEINFILKYKNFNDDKYKRVIIIDLKSGNAKWEYYETKK